MILTVELVEKALSESGGNPNASGRESRKYISTIEPA